MTCPNCHGDGKVERTARRTQSLVTIECPTCGGFGKLDEAPCSSCGDNVENPDVLHVYETDGSASTICGRCAL